MIYLLIILLCGVLNRVRGGGFGGDKLPGRALLWVSAAIGLLSWSIYPEPVTVAGLTAGWFVGAAFGLGFLFWGLWPWGHIFAALGGFAPDRAPSRLEVVLLKLPGHLLPAFVRMLFVLPCAAAVGWLLDDPSYLALGAAFAAASTAAYRLFLRRPDPMDWMRSEIATGALWGLLILAPLVML